MLPTPDQWTVATHWGTYRAVMARGAPVQLRPLEMDSDPSDHASGMIEALDDPSRIRRPMVRASFLDQGAKAGGAGRGAEHFIALDWPDALALVARELARVKERHGNGAIYGGSYGWASAGRFHHAQSQIHRFLNCIGGYTRSVQNYSYAAADTLLPHVVGDKRGLVSAHTSWDVIAEHTRLLVMFGGMSHKNSQVNSGGIGCHVLQAGLAACRRAGTELVSISPIRDDTLVDVGAQWMAPRPNTDVALMLGLAHTLVVGGLHDRNFLACYTSGFDVFEAYLMGRSDDRPKDAEWAAAISGVPAQSLRELAHRMARARTLVAMSWSLQRADHGEQPYWMAMTLAAMLGQIGLPGGGFGFGYGSVNGIGTAVHPFAWPSLPQGTNAIEDFIPVARISDMLLEPGASYDFNGERRVYPDIRLIYWAGGNPFHHHQDLNRLTTAWRKPETVIVHDSWWNALTRRADIVLPVTTQLERNDIVCSGRDRIIAASHRLMAPVGEARDDYAIFADLAGLLDARTAFTENRDEEAWLRHLYAIARQRITSAGLEAPEFDAFWRAGMLALPEPEQRPCLLSDFRADPIKHALATPSGRIEIFSKKVASFGYDDCPGHATWLEPKEWLGSSLATRHGLHLISNQPSRKLHSQYDNTMHARACKIKGREPIRIHPLDALARGINDGDIVRVHNDRGACLAGAVVSDAMRCGVVQLATGAWFDPLEPGAVGSLDKHGNPNVLTRDAGTSKLAQGPSAHSCLVEVERHIGDLPPITAYSAPTIVPFTTRASPSTSKE